MIFGGPSTCTVVNIGLDDVIWTVESGARRLMHRRGLCADSLVASQAQASDHTPLDSRALSGLIAARSDGQRLGRQRGQRRGGGAGLGGAGARTGRRWTIRRGPGRGLRVPRGNREGLPAHRPGHCRPPLNRSALVFLQLCMRRDYRFMPAAPCTATLASLNRQVTLSDVGGVWNSTGALQQDQSDASCPRLMLDRIQ